MKVGIPRELKDNEYRVAITPAGVRELSAAGHDVYVEHEAGVGSSITDDEFVAAGAEILPTADDVWDTADLVLKVKEPIAEEYHRMRAGQVLFTYLHLAASLECTKALLDSGITAVAYETVELPDRSLPLLAPMSEVAGRLAQFSVQWPALTPSSRRVLQKLHTFETMGAVLMRPPSYRSYCSSSDDCRRRPSLPESAAGGPTENRCSRVVSPHAGL